MDGEPPLSEAVNLLLVDDSPQNLLALDAILAPFDYQLFKALTGKEALRLARTTRFAVIMTDLMMPEMDGFALARHIRTSSLNQETPILFLTSVAKEDFYQSGGYSFGAADYLVKPLDVDEVRAKVAVFVQLFRQTEKLKRAQMQLRQFNEELEKKAEERAHELAASNERFRLFVESVEEYGFMQIDPAGRFIGWNSGAEKILGFMESEIIGQSFSRIFTDQDIAKGVPEKELQTALANGRADDTRWHQRKGGSLFWAHGLTTVLKDEGGRVRGYAKVIRDYTSQKRAEEALKASDAALQKSKRWFESVLDQMPIGVVIVELGTGLTISSNKTARQLGEADLSTLPFVKAENAEFLTDSKGRILGEEESPRMRTARGEQLQGLEVTRHRPGNILPLLINSAILPPMHGEPARGVLVFQDITKRKGTEQRLRESEEKFRMLANSIPQLTWMADGQGSIYWFNQRWYDYTGSKLDGAKDLAWRFVCHPGDIERVEAYFTECIKSGDSWEDVFPIRSHDASYRWFLSRAEPIKSADGGILEWFGTSTDVTESMVAEEANGRLAAIVNSSDDAIITKTLDGIITSWNDGAQSIFGYTAGEIIGHSIKKLIPADRFQEEDEFIANVLRGGRVSHHQTIRLGKDGRPVDISVSISPVNDKHGKVIGIANVARDIRQQKKFEKELQRAKETAEEASRSKSQFLANMSHEIRTPLNAIIGFAELLEANGLSEQMLKDFSATIRRNGRLLTQIIDDILDLSKVEAGKLTIDRIRCQLPLLLQDVEALMRQPAREKGIALTIRFKGPAPNVISTDPVRLKQVLINIIGNAVKFTSDGQVEVTITQNVRQTQRTIEFLVKDSGRGISPEQAGGLFQPFTQADASTTRIFGGTGLGLVLSRRLAQALGGNVELAESALGAGSTFKITIDAGPESDWTDIDALNSNNSSIGRQQPNLNLLKVKVLVAEDSIDSQKLIGHVLEQEGAEVMLAIDGEEAVKKALEQNPDIILMDLQMPKIDGLEAIKILRRHGFEKPIIALTAHAMKEARDESLGAGACDHVSKPINFKELIPKMQSLIKDKR